MKRVFVILHNQKQADAMRKLFGRYRVDETTHEPIEYRYFGIGAAIHGATADEIHVLTGQIKCRSEAEKKHRADWLKDLSCRLSVGGEIRHLNL